MRYKPKMTLVDLVSLCCRKRIKREKIIRKLRQSYHIYITQWPVI